MTIRHLYPVVEPSLNLNFANSRKLDPRITFTRASTGTYTDESGIIRTAAQDEARFDHDSDGNSLGLLIEESRTNLVPYSEDLVTANWSKNGTVSIVPSAGTSPSGTLTATRVEGTTTNWAIFKEYTVTPSTTYTLSFYAKRGTSTVLSLRLRDQTAPANITQRSYYSETSATEWTRIVETFTTPVGCVNLRVYPFVDCGIGDALIWGIQLEQGAFPTSYIPTTSSTVTRSADVASMTGTNFSSWYNQGEGSFFAESKLLGFSNFAFTASVNGSDGYIDAPHRRQTDSVFYSVLHGPPGNTNQVLLVSQTTSLTSTSKAANAFRVNDYAYCLNGGTVLVDNLLNLPTPTSLSIGGQNGNYLLNGHISRITYYPVRLPDATLQTLTL